MKPSILFVDDESGILEGLEMMLYKERKRWAMTFASSGQEGMEAMAKKTFGLVVSDMRMPNMNGIEFLTQVKEKSPDTTRVMLTGNADIDTATAAVNQGNVFRFLNKPCKKEVLIATLESGLEQYRLVTAEKELLNKTLGGSVKLLTEVLTIMNAPTFQAGLELREKTKIVLQHLRTPNSWELLLASMLLRLGYISLPPDLGEKIVANIPLSPEEQQLVEQTPEVGFQLIRHIPRLEGVARIVRYHKKCFDGSGVPTDDVYGEGIPVGARVLKVLNDCFLENVEEHSVLKKVMTMKGQKGVYDPQILEAIVQILNRTDLLKEQKEKTPKQIQLSALQVGDKLAEAIKTEAGQIIVQSKQVVTDALLQRIQSFGQITRVIEPITIISK